MSRDKALRPPDWDSYIGQKVLKDRLQISIKGAKARNDAMDHVLLAGGPGCGKTSIAGLIAQELGVPIKEMVMPVKPKALQKTFLEHEGVIFIDEVHRLSRKEQENLLTPLEDRMIQFENGKRAEIPWKFTVVAATTELERIIRPLRDRFTHQPRFEDYTDEEMAEIIKRMAGRIQIMIDDDEALALGRASAGIPRQARRIIYAARDLGTCDPDTVLAATGITADGLTEDHLSYLNALSTMGSVVGVDKISNFTGLPKDVLLELENLLVKRGYIEYTQKGRSLLLPGLKIVSPNQLGVVIP